MQGKKLTFPWKPIIEETHAGEFKSTETLQKSL
jgi:hypothetical protein